MNSYYSLLLFIALFAGLLSPGWLFIIYTGLRRGAYEADQLRGVSVRITILLFAFSLAWALVFWHIITTFTT